MAGKPATEATLAATDMAFYVNDAPEPVLPGSVPAFVGQLLRLPPHQRHTTPARVIKPLIHADPTDHAHPHSISVNSRSSAVPIPRPHRPQLLFTHPSQILMLPVHRPRPPSTVLHPSSFFPSRSLRPGSAGRGAQPAPHPLPATRSPSSVPRPPSSITQPPLIRHFGTNPQSPPTASEATQAAGQRSGCSQSVPDGAKTFPGADSRSRRRWQVASDQTATRYCSRSPSPNSIGSPALRFLTLRGRRVKLLHHRVEPSVPPRSVAGSQRLAIFHGC